MRRLLLWGATLVGLWAAEPDPFSSCIEKNRLAITQAGSFTALAVDRERLLVSVGLLSPLRLPGEWRLLRFDPLSGFALVAAQHTLEPAVFRKSDRIGEHPKLAVVEAQSADDAVLAQRQEGLRGARLDRPIRSGTVVCAPCYAVMGVGMLGAFMESDYLTHFINAGGEAFYWGDLGFRLYEGENRVRYISPFFAGNPFLPEDVIVSIGDVNVTNGREAARAVLLLEPDRPVKVRFLRANVAHETVVAAGKRLGGGLMADTFLEHLGWQLDQDLVVHAIVDQGFAGSRAVRPGDRLIQINGAVVKNSAQAQAVLSGYRGPVKLLMSRENFQFFITLQTERE